MDAIQTLADIPRLYAVQTPEQLALQFDTRCTSYRAWDARCNQLAHALLGAGVGPAGRVAYLGRNSDRLFDVLFGGAKIGAVLVPINWRLVASEIAFILDDARSRVLLIGSEYLPLLPELRAACPRLQCVVAVDGPAEGLPSYEDWIAGQPQTPPATHLHPDDVALQLYTSGTTGLPKGAQLTHANLLFAPRRAGSEQLGCWSADDVNLLPLPLFHAGGLGYGLYGPYWGATTVVAREASPAAILQAARASARPVTRMGLVPAVLQMVVDQPGFDYTPFAGLRTLTYGGSPIAPAVAQRALKAFGPCLLQLFGMTETAAVGTVLEPADHASGDPARLASCGRPLAGVDLQVVRSDGSLAAPGEAGEVRIRCGAVMAGYWNRPAASQEALRDGWYLTGDVGILDAAGYLSIQDRVKDMIISGGENVYPAEVERALMDHPAVADVAVIGVPDARWGEAVKAVVVLRAGADADAQALIDFARTRLAGYKCPKSVDFTDQLPRNATGKLLKRVLREKYWAGQARAVG